MKTVLFLAALLFFPSSSWPQKSLPPNLPPAPKIGISQIDPDQPSADGINGDCAGEKCDGIVYYHIGPVESLMEAAPENEGEGQNVADDGVVVVQDDGDIEGQPEEGDEDDE